MLAAWAVLIGLAGWIVWAVVARLQRWADRFIEGDREPESDEATMVLCVHCGALLRDHKGHGRSAQCRGEREGYFYAPGTAHVQVLARTSSGKPKRWRVLGWLA